MSGRIRRAAAAVVVSVALAVGGSVVVAAPAEAAQVHAVWDCWYAPVRGWQVWWSMTHIRVDFNCENMPYWWDDVTGLSNHAYRVRVHHRVLG